MSLHTQTMWDPDLWGQSWAPARRGQRSRGGYATSGSGFVTSPEDGGPGSRDAAFDTHCIAA
jgi:hypothetical protein